MIDPPIPESLSETELEVLRLLATGATNREIARTRGISEATVKKHVTNINMKLGTGNRTEAARRALELGLVTVRGPDGEVGADASALHREAARVLGEELERSRRHTRRIVWWFAGVGVVAVVAVLGLSWALVKGSPPYGGATPTAAAVPRTTPVPPIWSPGVKLPSPRTGLVLVPEPGGSGAVYAIAGRGAQGVLAETLRYDPHALAWQPRADKPTPVEGAAAAAIQGQVVVVGGCGSDGRAVDVTEIYDPATDTWHAGARLPHPVCGHALAEAGGQLYLFGGRESLDGAPQRWVWRYQLGATAWSDTPEDLPLPRADAAAVAVPSQDEIHLLGGIDDAGPQPSHWLFRPFRPSGQWTTDGGAPLPEWRAGLGAAFSEVADLAEGDAPTLIVTGGGWTREVDPWALRLDGDRWVEAPELRLVAPWRGAPLTVVVTREGRWLATAGGEAEGRLLDQYSLLPLKRYSSIYLQLP
jgi:DNA-binding CsgD family transcriptional regulator